MTNPIFRLVRGVAALALALALPAMGQWPVVLGEPAQMPKVAAPLPQLRLARVVAAWPALRDEVRLSPITDAALAEVRRENRQARPGLELKRIAIGVVRARNSSALPGAADLAWITVKGGQAAQMALTSPQAAALRVSIDLAGVPADVEMVFFGSGDPTRLVGPVRVGDIRDRTSPWWSPITDGETQTVEFFAPGAGDPRALGFRAVGVSHLFTGPSSHFEKRLEDIGSAGSCNVDVPCSPLETSGAFRDLTNAVAQMVFNDGAVTVLCTGTLLNDTDAGTQIPWFYSANHCFDNESPPYKTPAEMQAVANTLTTLWFFQSSSCNSGIPTTSYRQLSGGATYLYSNATSDVLFLRLNGTPPPGAYYAGWDPNTIGAGTPVVAVHFPGGDLMKASQGSVLGFSTPTLAPASAGVNEYINVRWSSGTTEPGSSGAGVFTSTGSQYLLRGALWGGGASCSTPASPDLFSRLDLAYPALANFLSPSPAPSTDYTDLWWNPDESGWGLNVTQHATRMIFAVWYTYGDDRKPAWFVLPSGNWTSSNTYTGLLYSVSGPPFNGAFDPTLVHSTAVGTGTLTFTDADHGTWSYTVNGVSGTKAITRQPY